MSRCSTLILVAALLMSSFRTSTWNRCITQFYIMSFAEHNGAHPSIWVCCLTLAPMRDEKTTFVSAASSTTSCFSILVSGFIVVSHSCSGIISPKPADAQKQRMLRNNTVVQPPSIKACLDLVTQLVQINCYRWTCHSYLTLATRHVSVSALAQLQMW